MARNKTIELTEEQKQTRDEIIRQQRDQLAKDAASANLSNTDFTYAGQPETIAETVVWGSKIPETVVVGERNQKPENATAQDLASEPAEAPAPAPAAPMTAEEIKSAQRERLVQDTKATLNDADFGAVREPEELDEVVVYAEKPKQDEVSDSNPNQSDEIRRTVVYGYRDKKSNPEEAEATPGEDSEDVAAPSGTTTAGEPVPDGANAVNPILGNTKASAGTIGNVVAAPYQRQNPAFADYVQSIADEQARVENETGGLVDAERNAAKWTGLTEMAASIANLVGVGQGNAISQQYKSYSQDWMQKADADARDRRNRIQDVRKRQDEIRLKMQQLKSEENLALARYELERQQKAIENEMARQKAALDAQFKAGQLAIDEYKAETQRIYNEARIKNDRAYNSARISRLNSQRSLDNAREENIRNGGSGQVKPSGKGNSGSGDNKGSGLNNYK
jgi:hypothetical protein